MSATRLAEAPALDARAVIRRLGRGRPLLWGLPAVLAAVYLIALLANFGAVIGSINTFADAVIAPVLAKLSGQAPPGSQVLLGHHPYYEEFLFLRATAGLPFYRGLWEVTPLLWTLLGFGILGWSARRALGAYPAVLTICALVCLGDLGRFSFFAFDWHGLTVVQTILIGSALVWLAPRAARLSWARLATVTMGLGLISALPAASDPLFPLWALVPMCATAALMAARATGRARWTPVVLALGTSVVALLVGAEIAHVMRAHDIRTSAFTYPLITSGAGMVSNLKLLFEGYMTLGGGNPFGIAPTLDGVMLLVNGVFVLVALASALLLAGWRLAATRRATTAASARPAAPATAYIGFWLSSLVLQCVAFVLSGAPQPNLNSSRYVLAGYVAIMALIGLLALRGTRWRVVVTAAVCVFAASSIFQLVRQPFVAYGPYPTAPVAQRLEAFARAHDVRYGYAGYWDAPDFTWLTGFRLPVYPITSVCGPVGICPYPIAQINSWYRPRPGTRSMMIADPTQLHVKSLDRRLGRPLATTRIGSLTVAVYPFDLAYVLTRRLTPTRS